jgi:hypothetical protein
LEFSLKKYFAVFLVKVRAWLSNHTVCKTGLISEVIIFYTFSRRLAHGSAAHVELAQRLAGLASHLGEHAEAETLLREATVAAYKDSRSGFREVNKSDFFSYKKYINDIHEKYMAG